ncbi:hypothetical protein AX16_003480 [Volvariella volvacea WC 439]|nr:hypothetical protein AX16_003480 [Volvariella volvacea WC 439]
MPRKKRATLARIENLKGSRQSLNKTEPQVGDSDRVATRQTGIGEGVPTQPGSSDALQGVAPVGEGNREPERQEGVTLASLLREVDAAMIDASVRMPYQLMSANVSEQAPQQVGGLPQPLGVNVGSGTSAGPGIISKSFTALVVPVAMQLPIPILLVPGQSQSQLQAPWGQNAEFSIQTFTVTGPTIIPNTVAPTDADKGTNSITTAPNPTTHIGTPTIATTTDASINIGPPTTSGTSTRKRPRPAQSSDKSEPAKRRHTAQQSNEPEGKGANSADAYFVGKFKLSDSGWSAVSGPGSGLKNIG